MELIVQIYKFVEEMLLLRPGASVQDKYTSTINPSQPGAKTEPELDSGTVTYNVERERAESYQRALGTAVPIMCSCVNQAV